MSVQASRNQGQCPGHADQQHLQCSLGQLLLCVVLCGALPAPNSQPRQRGAVTCQQSSRAVPGADGQCLSSGLCALPSRAVAVCSAACNPLTSYGMGKKTLSPINPFLAISIVKCLVIFSSSCSCVRASKRCCYYRPQEKSGSQGTAPNSSPSPPVRSTPRCLQGDNSQQLRTLAMSEKEMCELGIPLTPPHPAPC